jgi:hypothetical protein
MKRQEWLDQLREVEFYDGINQGKQFENEVFHGGCVVWVDLSSLEALWQAEEVVVLTTVDGEEQPQPELECDDRPLFCASRARSIDGLTVRPLCDCQ